MEVAALVPIKAFDNAKVRLAGTLSPGQRNALARWMAGRVVAAARPLPVFVACDDDAVAEFAEAAGATVLWSPGLGLNGAVDHGVVTLDGKGFEHVVIAHGDLPLAEHLGRLASSGRVTVVPDRRRDGTNVLARPCSANVPASYGSGSYRAHLRAALAAGLPVDVVHDIRLALDIDRASDCTHPLVADLIRPVVATAPERR